jgi:hypothetical protein
MYLIKVLILQLALYLIIVKYDRHFKNLTFHVKWVIYQQATVPVTMTIYTFVN